MSIRPHPTRAGAWYIDLGYGKNRERVPIEGTREDALFYEAERKKIMRPAKTSCFEKVGILIDRYLESYKLEHLASGQSTQVIRCQHLRPFFGKMLLQNITALHVEQYKQQRVGEEIKPTTINKELCALSGLFKWAEEMGVVEAPPCRIKKFPGKMTKAPIPHVPSRDEIDRIIAEVPAKKRGLFELMFFLGLRRTEALTLRKENINLERQTLVVIGKGGKERVIPIMDAEMLAELKFRCETTKSGYLWESPLTKTCFKDIRGTLKQAAKRAGVEERVYSHLLRHACGTETLETGDLRDVQVLLGHTSSKTTEIYTHIRQDRLKRVMLKRLDK